MAVRQTETGYRLYWPEFGGIAVIATLPFAYLLVQIGMPLLVDDLKRVFPGIVPEPFITVVSVVLWASAAILVLYVVKADALLTLHHFADRSSLESHIQSGVHDRRWYVLAVTRFLVGIALIVGSGDRFVTAFEHFLDLAVITAEELDPAFTGADAIWLLAFFTGFLLFAKGFDQIIVATARTRLHRTYIE